MKNVIVHPFLFAAYPIVFLYAHNVQEVSRESIYAPLIFAVIFAALLNALLGCVLKDKIRTGMITSFFILIIFTYGSLYNYLVSLDLLNVQHRYLLPILIMLGGYGAYFIWNARNNSFLERMSRGLNYIALFLIVINLIPIVRHEVQKLSIEKVGQEEGPAVASGTTHDVPDIYYIVLDEYASLDTIKKVWNYDNSQFAASLKEKGFFIAEHSRTPYIETQLCLASYLNMMMLEKSTDINCYQMIADNKVVEFLKSKGYRIYYFGNWFDAGRYKIKADYDIHFIDSKEGLVDEFALMAINASLLTPLSYLFETEKEDYNAIPYIFKKLHEVPHKESPKFIFAHIMSPHGPFLFNESGGKIDSTNAWNWKDKTYYLGQYIFITKQIYSLVDAILTNSKNPPIIVIQSDHGPRPSQAPRKNERFVISDIEMHKIFSAFYFPDRKEDLITDDISPVDTFKIIFRQYFHEKLK